MDGVKPFAHTAAASAPKKATCLCSWGIMDRAAKVWAEPWEKPRMARCGWREWASTSPTKAGTSKRAISSIENCQYASSSGSSSLCLWEYLLPAAREPVCKGEVQ